MDSLDKFLTSRGLLFYNAYVKNLISESGMGVTDITSDQTIPQLTDSGSLVYYVKTTTTTIQKDNTTVTKLPSDVTGPDVFILDICNKNSTSGEIVNSYLLFDNNYIYTGKAISGTSSSATGWTKISGEASDYLKQVTTAQYEALTSAQKNSGVVYFVTDKYDNTVSMASVISTLTNKGEATLETLPSAPSTNDFYFLTDELEGRYWNGTAWITVI